jgi:Skp family chaperone for outer membrane proteins
MRIGYLIALLTLCVGLGGEVRAQGGASLGTVISPILTIDSERLFVESDFGKRVASEIEADLAVLAAENRSIEAELTAEEKTLTDQRPEMTPADFRAVADAFDERVQIIRREQLNKELGINKRREQAQIAFLQAAQPILAELMRQSEAAVILERNSIFISANAIDITGRAIEQLNMSLGDGAEEGQE